MKNLTFIFLISLHISLFTFHLAAQPCLPDGITFTNQAQIDNFQTNYPGCTEIEGDVDISGEDISNMNGLSVLTSINGSLIIEYCESLINLTGFNSLTSIGGDLRITSNDALTSLSGLESVSYIGESIIIGSNVQPTMPPTIGGNPSLPNLMGLNSITTINGMVYIRANGSLTSLSGLESLVSVGGAISVKQEETLLNFNGLESLINIGQSLVVYGNQSLASFSGQENVTSIGGGLYVGDHTCLGEDGGNPALSSLTGLGNITSIEGEFSIINNETLTSLLNLQSIAPGSIDSITIIDNTALSLCHVEAICDYLEGPAPVVEVYGNATGCSNLEELEDACIGVSIEELISENSFTISPNPLESTAIVQFSLPQNSLVSLKIFDLSGQLVVTLVNEFQQKGEQKIEFNSTGLPAGVYFCTLKTNHGIKTTKLIKQ